ncbi:isoleucine--tRNA ligase [Microbacterium sp. EYE_5]|uniref:isoleucine--tRNA ligase n=1 Tax=unclassified Microbacterium TaxID=2609290 RepID=UPI002004FC2B|nr:MULTISPECIES: isoleucine--tRNA ligase [unclassified Microbacterium]MCK6080571.1 isoleucine--tRNA ligase [Microbacterium sp. EYE_382]MCK6085842.1 isoleucine--tRNA ligase [Microbacterium sp. EYE_384]MCK6124660.1 isoleucine--tRNA ligase [Microbacterium sp. EYE_80]MCK6127569.1 isoleucine--tRNA ligase [Microbacterium sp. EYE_79]MCK6141526.1 isoleucine--tRNA ligase [Microbacterium sp. EYE_39]
MTYPRPSAFGPAADAPAAVVPSPRFPDLEREVLAFWEQDDTFRASIAQRDGADEWVFYDGPPFANGLPHYGHLLTGYAKDLFPRFQTMRGKKVDRVFGWDTHGLPAELEAMKQLGITEKSEIEEMGIAAFNAKARSSVLEYTQEWENYVTRQARWVDFERGYKTLDTGYMESVLWAFKELYDKDLAYEGHRVLPYCWRDETPLSNHELRMDDDVYKMRQDPSVTVTFPLVGAKAEALGLTAVRALAWTTTPWTLPTNLALAVGPDIEYVVLPGGPAGAADIHEDALEGQSHRYLLAADLLANYAKDLGYASADEARDAVDQTVRGADLADVAYDRLFDYYADKETWGTQHAWRILVDDYVTTTDGTGIVHQAPAYGEDDQRVTGAAGIPLIMSLDDGGRFLPQVTDVAGELWMDANRPLIRLLKAEGRLLREASYEHSYPHCWRCRNPLIYKAVSSWFVRVTSIKDRLVELNEQITWAPENVKHGQFGKWLEGARDWSISRNRFWGSPIPVWKSDDPEYPRVDVYGSLEDLERDFGRLPVNEANEVDLHRPFIDDLTRPNPDDPTGNSTMRRIEDVFDVWFDSGSMPYAQVHYPFENRDWFDEHAPADFIVEYIGQTRGWFYVMHVLSGALFDRPAFSGVACHGIVLGSDGQKMSKSLRNYPDVSEVFDRDGSDAMRWFLMSSSVLRGGNLVVTEEGIRSGVREFLLPLWNAWYFFSTYANAAGGPDGVGYEARRRTDSTNVLDRHILALTGDLVRGVAADLEALDSTMAAAKLREFAEALTNWYIRRSRDRFWVGVDAADPTTTEAFDTLFTVLETLTRVAAPLIPLVSERVWRGLTGGRSVHLEDWPDADEFAPASDIREAMDTVREVSSVANALRKKEGKRVRLPLANLTVAVGGADALAQFEDIVRDELNVKAVEVVELTEGLAEQYGISQRLAVNARAAGPRLGKQVQHVIKGAKAGLWSEEDGVVVVDGIALEPGEYDLTLEAGGVAEGTAIALLPRGGFVLLDTTTTPELEAEGLARDVIRAVQDARKAAGFEVSDRIALQLTFDDTGDAEAVAAAFDVADVAGETLSVADLVATADGTALRGEALRSTPEHTASVPAGTYANAGSFTIGVRRIGATS